MSADEIADTLISTTDCKQGAVRAVRFSADGNYCITCGSNKTIQLRNPNRGTLIKEYNGHGYEVLDAEGSFDNANLCSCGMDKCVIYWDVATGKVRKKYRGHAGQVNCVRFNEEATVILSGSIDGTVKTWDCRSHTNKPIQVLDEAKDSVTCLRVCAHEVLTACLDGRIRRYDLRMGQMIVDFIGKPTTCVNLSRDGQCMLISSLDSTLRLLDKKTGELLNDYTGHANEKYQLESCVSGNDSLVMSGSEDGKVYIWRLIENMVVRCLEHKERGTVHTLSHHPTDTCLLTACENRLYVWKTASAADEESDTPK